MLGVEVAGRLVGEDQLGLGDEGAGDRDALLLAARELAGAMARAMGDADLVHHLVDTALALGGGDVVVEQGQLDILAHRQLVDQVEALEDEADVGLAHVGELALREAGDLLSVEQVRTARRAVEHADHVEQGRFAAARRAHDRDELALGDVKVDRVERGRLDRVGAIDLREFAHLEHRASFH